MLSISQFLPIIVVILLCTTFDHSLASSSSNNNNINNGKGDYNVQNSVDVDTLIQKSLDDLSNKMAKFENDNRRRPFVTLSYAQSIDGKIALMENGNSDSASTTKTTTSSNFAISGPESLRLTHALRSIHNAILVGGRTLSVDNPRLTNRLWPTTSKEQCTPVILDTNLRHIRLLGNKMRAQNPIVCCSVEAYEQARGHSGQNEKDAITSKVILLPCSTRIVGGLNQEKRVLDLHDVLSKLRDEHGINSVMIEGGASVLSLFVQESFEDDEKSSSDAPLFDCLCVTISPKLLGANGLDSLSSFAGSSKTGSILGPLKCITLGDDCILFADRRN